MFLESKTEGFTFIELLITLSILALTVAFSAPAVSDWGPHFQLRSDVNEIRSNLQKARFEAIKRSQPVTVNFSTAEPESLVAFLDANTNGAIDAGEALWAHTFDGKTNFGRDGGVALNTGGGVDLSGASVVFRADGSLRDTAGNVLFGQVYLHFDPAQADLDPGNLRNYAVTLSASGSTAITKWDDHTSSWD